MSGRIQKQDVKTLSELLSNGGQKSDLIQDSQIYISELGGNFTLAEAIHEGIIAGNFPLVLKASSTPDSKLNISANRKMRTNGITDVTGTAIPVVPDVLDSTIDFQTGATTGATFAITIPSSTAGQFRRATFSLRSDSVIEVKFTPTATSTAALVNPGSYFVSDSQPIGWIDLESTGGTGYKTAGSSANVIENKVGSASCIFNLARASSVPSSSNIEHKQAGTGAVTRKVQDALRFTVSVADFGAVGDGSTDDKAAIQAALDSLGVTGGTVFLERNKIYYVASNLTIPNAVTLAGHWQNPGDPTISSATNPFNTIGSAIKLNAAATINISSASCVRNLMVYQSALVWPIADIPTFSGTAFSLAGVDASIDSVLALGFNQAVTSGTDTSRAFIHRLYVDCANGINLFNAQDMVRIENCHFWPFLTATLNNPAKNRRAGDAYYVHDISAGVQLIDCFAYGYRRGFYIKNTTATALTNCVANSTGEYVSADGFVFEGSCVGLQARNCASMGTNVGARVNTNANQMVHLIGFTFTSIIAVAIIVSAGDANILESYFSTLPAVLGVTNTASRVRFDYNTMDTVSTSHITSTGTNRNVIVGENNVHITAAAGTSLTDSNMGLPQIASADPLALPVSGNIFEVTGTVQFDDISGGWKGRRFSLVFTSALTIASTGNIKIPANYAVKAGETLSFVCDASGNYYMVGRSNTAQLFQNTLANIMALSRKAGNVYYAQDTNKAYLDNGSTLSEVRMADTAVDVVHDVVDQAGVEPVLDLNFTSLGAFPRSCVFTRNSPAAYVNKNGLLAYATANIPRIDHDPVTFQCRGFLVEETRTNLLKYDEAFDNAYWFKVRGNIAQNSIVAPDGTLSAAKFIEDNATGFHYLYANDISIAANTTHTFSLYVKAGERSVLSISLSNGAGTNYFRYDFNLATQAFVMASVAGTATPSGASIVPAGNGWYRITATGIVDATSTTMDCTISLGNVYPANINYAGDGFSGAYIWGAQLEVGSFATSLIHAQNTFTSRASVGTYFGSDGLLKSAANDAARMNYTPSNLNIAPKLLLEPAATNLITNSEQLEDVLWSKSSITVTANNATAPDGTVSADLIEATSTVGGVYVARTLTTNTGVHCASVFVKSGTSSSGKLYLSGDNNTTAHGVITFNLATRTVTDTVSTNLLSAGIQDVGNGWFRVWLVCNLTTNSAPRLYMYPSASASLGNIYFWGAQVETGYAPTSYIPTTTATATRTADISTSAPATRQGDYAVISGTEFKEWFRQDEGTIFVDFDSLGSTFGGAFSAGQPVCFSDGTSNSLIRFAQDATKVYVSAYGNVSYQFDISALNNAGNKVKVAHAYKFNDGAAAVSGQSSVFTDSSYVVPLVDRLNIGSYYSLGNRQNNGHIKRLTYFPVRINNATLQNMVR